MSSYDTPILGISGSEVSLDHQPKIDENVVEFAQDHRLRDGSLRRYHRGDRYKFRLSFANMNTAQRDELYGVYKSHQELHFQPRPDSDPTTHYTVRWTGGFNIGPFRGMYIIGYEGVVDLDSVKR